MRKVICFHNPDEGNGYLSNWYLSDFTVDGVRFSLMEQYMMYKKASIFHDEKTAGEILRISDAGRIKALGRSVRNYDDVIWNGVRQITECAVQDRIWGIGLSMQDERRFRLDEWRGHNLLGFALMSVRDELT